VENTEAAISRIELAVRMARVDLDHIEAECREARRLLEAGDWRGVEACFEEISRWTAKDGRVF